jgi:Tfp pilus assembly protein PilO
MARSESSGLRSAKTQIALVVLVAVGLGVAYWQLFYSTMQEDEARLQANYRKLEKENKTLSEEERIQNDMIKCKPELDALNRENELMLPAEAEPVAFLKNLSSMAASAGLQQGPTRMAGETEVQAPPASAEEKRRAEARRKSAAPAGKGGKGAIGGLLGGESEPVPCWEKVPGLHADEAAKATFVRVPFAIEVRGTFHQLMRYFWMLHEHANTGRIITVEDLTLTDPEAGVDGISMTAKFVAVGFREPDGTTAPAADVGDVGAARGGKAQVREATQRREAQVEAASEGGGGAGAETAAPAAAQPPAAPAAGQQPAGAAGAAQGAEPADKAQRGLDRITRPEGQ